MQKNQKIWIGLGVVLLVAVMIFLGLRNQGQKAGDGDVIKIGVILPLTGGASSVGVQAQRGFTLAANDINAQGGIRGKKIQLVFEDSPLDTKTALNAYQKLRAINNIKFYLSCFSQNSMVIAETIKSLPENEKTVLMTTHLQIEDFPKISPYVFRVNITSKSEAECFYSTLVERLGYTKPALYISNDEFGKDMSSHFLELCKKNNIAIAKAEMFERGQVDHKSGLEKIKTNQPDVVIFLGNDQTTASAINQARQIGIPCQLATTCAVANPNNWKIAAEGAENILYTTAKFDYEPDNDDIQKAYREEYLAEYNEQTNFLSANAYTVLELLAMGMRTSEDLTPNHVARDLGKFKDVKTLLGKISFNEYGDAPLEVIMLRLVNNKGVPVDKSN